MAKQLLIKAKPREDKKPRALRREGFVPATLYGHNMESRSIQVNAREFSRIPHKAYSHLNKLEIEGDQEPHDILIKDVQRHPYRDIYENIQFYQITRGEKIKIKVPLKFEGHSPAITLGGMLIVSHNDVEIQCLPKDIPDDIKVNMEEITEIGQSIHAKDLKAPEGVEVTTHESETIVKVEAPKVHQVEDEKPAEEAAAEGDAAKAEGDAAKPAEGDAAKAEDKDKDKK